jgi:Mg2+/Co2+ transporter CorC
MALVRDTAGRIHGMITLEDVIEQIVGDIEDEHDRPVRKLRFRRRPAAKKPEPKHLFSPHSAPQKPRVQ